MIEQFMTYAPWIGMMLTVTVGLSMWQYQEKLIRDEAVKVVEKRAELGVVMAQLSAEQTNAAKTKRKLQEAEAKLANAENEAFQRFLAEGQRYDRVCERLVWLLAERVGPDLKPQLAKWWAVQHQTAPLQLAVVDDQGAAIAEDVQILEVRLPEYVGRIAVSRLY